MLRALLCAGALLVLLAPAASAASRDDIIRDCADDGRLDGKYTQSEIRDARRNLPTDVDEYTDCRDVLRRAELPSGGGSSSGPGGGGGGTLPGGGATTSGGGTGPLLAPSTPEETKSLADARERSTTAVAVGDERVVPGAAGFAAGAARHDLPWPLLAVLIMLGIAAGAAAIAPIRRRVHPRHRTA